MTNSKQNDPHHGQKKLANYLLFLFSIRDFFYESISQIFSCNKNLRTDYFCALYSFYVHRTYIVSVLIMQLTGSHCSSCFLVLLKNLFNESN